MTPVDKIDPRPLMKTAGVEAVIAALSANGAVVRFVGGCVRDAVMGRPPGGDIDLATADQPETVIALLEAAGLRALPTGIAHGTVTAVAGRRPVEVTTLRRDVETDGRHARVAFTDDWEADAARRDFTMNALFCDPDGALYDPVGGLDDAVDLGLGNLELVLAMTLEQGAALIEIDRVVELRLAGFKLTDDRLELLQSIFET